MIACRNNMIESSLSIFLHTFQQVHKRKKNIYTCISCKRIQGFWGCNNMIQRPLSISLFTGYRCSLSWQICKLGKSSGDNSNSQNRKMTLWFFFKNWQFFKHCLSNKDNWVFLKFSNRWNVALSLNIIFTLKFYPFRMEVFKHQVKFTFTER